MISEIFLCAFCFALGGLSRFCFVGVTVAERRIGHKAIAFALDFAWGVFTVASIACVIFVFNNGITMPYMVIAALFGFCITAVFV